MSNAQTITAAVLKGGRWELKQIARGLKPLQELVGGYIEFVPLDDERVTLYCNDEGKILGLPPTAAWVDPKNGEVLDLLAGNLVALGPLDDEGDYTDATLESIAALEKHLVPVGRVQRRAS